MKKGRFTTEQMIAILNEEQAGINLSDLCRRHGISEQTYYHWKAKYERLLRNL
jgi:putative transposase